MACAIVNSVQQIFEKTLFVLAYTPEDLLVLHYQYCY